MHAAVRLVISLGLALALPAAAGPRPTWGVEAGAPQRATVSVGLLLGDARGDGFDLGRNLVLVQVQPGLGGGRVSLGFAPFAASASGLVFAGVALKASLLRTWGTPSGAAAGQTYVGAQLDVAWIVKGSVGWLTRVGAGGAKHTLVTWSVGVGL